MEKKIKFGSVLVLALCATTVFSDDIHGITMDFEYIGGGNAADTTGYGAVGYNYRIGTTEVSIQQYQASPVGDTGNPYNYWNSGGRTVGTDAPVVSITWHQAAMYCNWLTTSNVLEGAYTISGGLVTAVTARNSAAMDALVATNGTVYVLPTEDEWYKAAYYKNGSYSQYANGPGSTPVHGTNANFSASGGYFNGPAWKVDDGTFEQNGTKNMMGNVWEWLESADDGTLDNVGTENMAFRGGDYFQGITLLDKENRGGGTDPNAEYYNTGFRVVAIPEPGTISLMSLSTVGLFLTRRIRRRRRLGQTLMPVRRKQLCDTFCTEQEWRMEEVEQGDEDFLRILFEVTKEGCIKLWMSIRDSYKSIDKAFWNRMVVIHDRKVARRKALGKALREKAMNSFDAFLAMIMK